MYHKAMCAGGWCGRWKVGSTVPPPTICSLTARLQVMLLGEGVSAELYNRRRGSQVEADASYHRPLLPSEYSQLWRTLCGINTNPVGLAAPRFPSRPHGTKSPCWCRKLWAGSKGQLPRSNCWLNLGRGFYFSKLISLAENITARKIPSEQNMLLPRGGSMNYKSGIWQMNGRHTEILCMWLITLKSKIIFLQ